MNDAMLTVTRWRRYGHDRLYVRQPDGVKVGWWDLIADEPHPETPEAMTALRSAAHDWATGHATGAPTTGERPPAAQPNKTTPARAAADAPAEPPVRPWTDLAANQAGAAARERALAARAAAPVRTTLARVLGVKTDERAWRLGAVGESLVAAQLTRAGRKDPRWRFLHAIPVGDRGSDIDHLVVGPGGVFTVNAKHHPRADIWVGANTFLVNGHRQPYLRNSRHEAARAARLLTAACGFEVHVEGLIVTVNAADVTVKTPPDGVHVTWRNDLARWLLRHGDIHDVDTLESVYAAARRSTTWR